MRQSWPHGPCTHWLNPFHVRVSHISKHSFHSDCSFMWLALQRNLAGVLVPRISVMSRHVIHGPQNYPADRTLALITLESSSFFYRVLYFLFYSLPVRLCVFLSCYHIEHLFWLQVIQNHRRNKFKASEHKTVCRSGLWSESIARGLNFHYCWHHQTRQNSMGNAQNTVVGAFICSTKPVYTFHVLNIKVRVCRITAFKELSPCDQLKMFNLVDSCSSSAFLGFYNWHRGSVPYPTV